MRKKTLRSPRLARKTREKTIKRVVLISLLSVCVAGALVYALLQPEFRIQEVTVEGSDSVPKERITEFMREGLRGSYLGVIPKEHILFYPKESLKAGALAAFPSLSRVDLSRSSFSAIRVSAIAREPSVIWCESESCFFMDESGTVFEKAPSDSSLLYRLVSEGAATSTPLGEMRLDAGQLSSLVGLLTELETLGLETAELRIEQSGEHTVVLRGGARLLFSAAPFDAALSRLRMLLSEKGLVPRRGTAGLNVDYVDLRFGNKIYFK